MGHSSDLPVAEKTTLPAVRVLFLATFFPRPLNMLLGPWALAQAQALRRRIPDFQVVSLTPWVPTAHARATGGAAAYARCPKEHYFGELPVLYPRWILYPIQPLKRWAYPDPWRQLRWGWHSAARSLRRIVRQTKPDVIFAHHTAANGYVARQLQREFGLPYVVTDHDFDEVRDCGRFPRRRELFAEVYENASAVVAVSRRMENDMRRLFPNAPTHTVHNGVEPLPGNLRRNPRPAELSGRKVIFSAGMFYQRKGFPLLIDAFSRIAVRHPAAILRIAGDGPDRALVEEAVRKADLGDRVQLLGKLSHDAVLQEMVWSDLFALIGWDEPFATVFIEAMSAGKPLLCANDGGINDVVIDGVHGRTVPPKDAQAAAAALDRLLSDDAGRPVMGAAAAKLVDDKLTWNANANAMLALFQEAAGRAGTP
jgi:glycosyltransferase involved in cell wall biosynthesis